MILVVLVGLLALVAGRITILRNLTLTGVNARLYGILLIILAAPAVKLISWVLQRCRIGGSLLEILLVVFVNVGAAICFLVVFALPFRQMRTVNVETAGRNTSLLTKLLFSASIAALCGCLFYFGVTRGVSTMGRVYEIDTENRSSGKLFGSGNNVEACIARFIAQAPSKADLDAMIALSSFNSGCVTETTDFREWCVENQTALDMNDRQEKIRRYCINSARTEFPCSMAVETALRSCDRTRSTE